MHLAGPTDCGGYLVDTHDQPVPTKVWELYQLAQKLTNGVSTLLEWDANIPPYEDLVQELLKAKAVLKGDIPNVGVEVAQKNVVSNPINFQIENAYE